MTDSTHNKTYVSNDDCSIRLFENDFLEALTKVHPVTPLLIFVPAIAYWLFLSEVKFGLGWSAIAVMALCGMVSWTFFEYALHRYVFHLNMKTPFLKRIHFLFHGIHHAYPSDSRRLVMPPTVSVSLAAILYGIGYLILPKADVPAFFAGFFSGYLFYDMTHFAIHCLPVQNPLLVAIRRHHFRHHYQDPHSSYGVSSALWDRAFRTLPENRRRETTAV